ncbi:MAG: PRD domain-containing protein [Angelakisella sp.]
MIQLTSRQQSVLALLLIQKGPLPVKRIAEQYNLSERTIRYDLDLLKTFIKLRGGTLVQRPGVGVELDIPEPLRKELQGDVGGQSSPERVLSKEERVKEIKRTLLLSETPVTVDMLAEQLLVSRTTVVADIQQVRAELAKKQLQLAGKKGEGYHIEGSEGTIRTLIVDTLMELMPPHYAVKKSAMSTARLRSIPQNGSELSLAAAYLCQVDMDTLVRLMASAKDVIPYNLHSTEQLRFLIYLTVLVVRARAGYTVLQGSDQELVDMDSRENQLAQFLAGRLTMWFHLTLSDGEIRLIAVWLIACNVKFAPKANDKIIMELSEIVNDMLLVLQDFPEYELPEFYMDKLKMNLVSHLKLTIKKYNLQISALNTLLTQMKVNYPEIFTVSYRMAERFERRTGIALGEDEIGFIAIHIAASVEECSRLQSKKAIIVCNTGRGAAQVLYNRICSNIPRLDIQGTISALDAVESDALNRIDFVISTIDLPDIGKPLFRVSPIITAAEIARINNYINGNLGQPTDTVGIKTELSSTAGSYEEAAVMRCAMILARLGSVAGELSELYDVELTSNKVFGLAIHLLMSIPRWEKGIYNRELAHDKFKEDNIDMFNFVAKLLREASKECCINIPDKEALAIMRYFV